MTFAVPTLSAAGGEFTIQHQPVPTVSLDGLLLRVELGGVCATDVHIAQGHIPDYNYPSTLGHEVTGIVQEVGADFGTDVRGVPVRPGDRIVVMPATPCGTCSSCKAGSHYPECAAWDVVGFSNPESRPAGGGWGQYVSLNARARVFVTTAPAENAVLAEPASTPIEGLMRSGFRFGDSVLIQGTGTVGLLAIAAAAWGGASAITAIGGPTRRLEIAAALGATHTFDIADTQGPSARAPKVMDVSPCGAGYDYVLECAGVPDTISEGLSYLKRGGCFIELGHFSDVGEVAINPYRHILSRDARLVSSSGYTADSFDRALTLVENLGAAANQLITHRLPAERVEDAIGALQPSGGWRLDGSEVGKIVIDPWLQA